MKSVFRAALLVVAVAAIAIVPISATGQVIYETELTIKGPNGDFSGKIKSDEQECETGRKVTVFKKKPGKDKKVGDDTSDSGKWSTGNSGEKKGKFYAKVGSDFGICEKAKSKTIEVEET